jgi:hypothetical protein
MVKEPSHEKKSIRTPLVLNRVKLYFVNFKNLLSPMVTYFYIFYIIGNLHETTKKRSQLRLFMNKSRSIQSTISFLSGSSELELPHSGGGGGVLPACGRGVGGVPVSDEGTDTMVLKVYTTTLLCGINGQILFSAVPAWEPICPGCKLPDQELQRGRTGQKQHQNLHIYYNLRELEASE